MQLNSKITKPDPETNSNIANQRRWGALEAIFVGVFGSFAFQLLVGVGVSLLIPDFEGFLEGASNSTQFVLNLIAVAAGFLPIVLYLLAERLPIKSLGFDRRPRWRDFGRMLVVYGVYLVGIYLAFWLVSFFVSSDILTQDQEIGFTQTSSLVELLIIFITLVVLAPVFEEMIYRGFIFQGFKRSFGFIPALLLSSLIFALVHGQVNVGIDTFILGMGLAYLYHRSGSLWPSIGLHMLKNFIAFSLLFL